MFPWAALSLFAPSLLGGIFGRNDPAKERERKLMELFSQSNINKTTNNFWQQFLNSPAYGQGLGQIAAGTNSLTNSLNRSLGARGLSQSGIGAVASPLASSAAGFKMADFTSAGYAQALQHAMESLRMQGGALAGAPMAPNYGAELFGAGLSGFGNILEDWLKTQRRGQTNAL